ncbi:MAG: hypothetical protein JNJ54_01300 [Myxococcaceae bacterium]|nr:hypothetical protein [Myxococcaceae bacterium]
MLAIALTVSLVLAQDPEPAAEPPPDDAPAAAPAPDGTAAPTGAQPSGTGGPDPAITAMKRQTDELARAAAKLKELTGQERDKALEELRKKTTGVSANPVLPPRDFNLEEYFALSEPEQAFVVARSFFEALVSGDAGRVVDYAGLPFMLEDRRIERPDELRSIWAKHLRSKRTDLLALYGIEVMTPPEMEKKYGQPPPRLKSWPWRSGPQQYLAVANVSGRAAVVLLRYVGSTWQVIAYHD